MALDDKVRRVFYIVYIYLYIYFYVPIVPLYQSLYHSIMQRKTTKIKISADREKYDGNIGKYA